MARSYSSGSSARASESLPNTTGKIGDGSDGRGVIDKDGYLNLREKDAAFFAKQEPKVSLSLNPNLLEGSTYTIFKLPNGKRLMFTQVAEWDRNGKVEISSVDEEVLHDELEGAGYKNIGEMNAFRHKMQDVLDKTTKQVEAKFKEWFEQKVDKPTIRMAIRDARDYKPKDMADEGDIRISGVEKPIPVVKKGDTYAIDFDKARAIMSEGNGLSDKGIEKVVERLKKNGFQQA